MLVDDHNLVRAGIKLMLQNSTNVKIVAEAKNGEESTRLAKETSPDVVLMDLNMPGTGGLEATRKLLRINPDIKVLVITTQNDELFPTRLLQAGAAGYITKDASVEEMLSAIKAVNAGQRYISPSIANQLALSSVSKHAGSPFEILSERELQILLMIAHGKLPRIIAGELHLSPKTVNSYRYRIFTKLSVQSDVELTLLAVRHGLLEHSSDSAMH
jgi:two-component system invasion response regulator UvrY